MNTISYKDLRAWYLDNEQARANAKQYFGSRQPNSHLTGYYKAPSWNWSYQIGIVGVDDILTKTTQWFEVVTQFGEVKAARKIYLPVVGA